MKFFIAADQYFFVNAADGDKCDLPLKRLMV